jgi:hypothetical protein
MNKAVLNSMTKTERRLVSETERAALVELDEDALLELHGRVRRARTKYLKNYRRAASARVVESGSRGDAYPKNQRDRDKAEVFELALARVSRAGRGDGQAGGSRASSRTSPSGSRSQGHPRPAQCARPRFRRGQIGRQIAGCQDHWRCEARCIGPGNGRSASSEEGQSLRRCSLEPGSLHGARRVPVDGDALSVRRSPARWPDGGQRVPALLAGRVSQKSQAARDRAERAREMLRNALAEQAEADAGS